MITVSDGVLATTYPNGHTLVVTVPSYVTVAWLLSGDPFTGPGACDAWSTGRRLHYDSDAMVAVRGACPRN